VVTRIARNVADTHTAFLQTNGDFVALDEGQRFFLQIDLNVNRQMKVQAVVARGDDKLELEGKREEWRERIQSALQEKSGSGEFVPVIASGPVSFLLHFRT